MLGDAVEHQPDAVDGEVLDDEEIEAHRHVEGVEADDDRVRPVVVAGERRHPLRRRAHAGATCGESRSPTVFRRPSKR